MLAAGAIPAFSVLYLRRRMPETARYLARLAADPGAALAVIREIGGETVVAPPKDSRPFGQVFAEHARPIFSAALLWFVFDIVVYSSMLFGPSPIAKGLGMGPIEFALLTQAIFVISSCAICALYVLDKVRRKPLQVWGFIGAAVMLGIFALIKPSLATLPILGFFVFGLYNVAINGAAAVSRAGILGVELSPTGIRTVGQSITVVGGRIGASISAFLFPVLFTKIGKVGVIALLAILWIIGAVLTQTLVPETARVSLEALSNDHVVADVAGD